MHFEIIDMLNNRIAGPYENAGTAVAVAERAQGDACRYCKGKLAKALMKAFREHSRQTGTLGLHEHVTPRLYRIRNVKNGNILF